ncbi:peptidylprolyl isomerase [Peribacillus sp. SCS-26]|uniref:peptidylprolyl isomerase n=1 Tax=Paraperibacillus marinus TaxID=3115295 RepID=UPI003905CE6F
MKTNLFFILLSLLLITACGTSGGSGEKSGSGGNKQESRETEKLQDMALEDFPQFKPVQKDDKVVLMETTKGSIKIKLFPAQAPKAVENFITHSEKGYYDNLAFHRLIKDFMIQGGDPNGDGTGGESIWGKPFKDEFSERLFNVRGALSMANSGADTNGSQFFIVQNQHLNQDMPEEMKKAGYPQAIIKAYEDQGGTPWLDQKHTVFGQVIEGMEVVDKIAAAGGDEQGTPAEKITIRSIKIIQ